MSYDVMLILGVHYLRSNIINMMLNHKISNFNSSNITLRFNSKIKILIETKWYLSDWYEMTSRFSWQVCCHIFQRQVVCPKFVVVSLLFHLLSCTLKLEFDLDIIPRSLLFLFFFLLLKIELDLIIAYESKIIKASFWT